MPLDGIDPIKNKEKSAMTTKEIIEQIAHNHHTTPEEVEAEMRKAICAAMESDDPKAQAMWKRLAPDGKEPSIERFIQFCVEGMKGQGNS